MATTNDITGDLIKTKANDNTAYAEGWDRIFAKKNKVADDQVPTDQPVVVPEEKTDE